MLGTAFNIAYWHRKYHSGTICKGVRNQIIEAQDLKLIQAQILIDFQLEDNKHKEEEGKRAGEKEMNCEPFHRECFYVTGTHFFL